MSDRHRDRYREHGIRTSLQRVAPSVRNPEEFREEARQLWRHFGILVVWPDQNIGGWPEKAQRDNMGNRLYGERIERGGR